tara:strand:+ start:30 stop:1022 length:993 start_codon:yes stop_codon:yes gene_type:complete
MKIIKYSIMMFFLIFNVSYANEDFNIWLDEFSTKAISQGISQKTVNDVLKKARFLPSVIKYDRYQPEFYEDTKTYIGKRATKKKLKMGINLFNQNKNFIKDIENVYSVEKELLLSLMAIETNYGSYLGKMDIISSLATLSFDKRRSEFFSNELLIALNLIDQKLINPDLLYGSWAGAFGNFQFMPSTIKNYAVDYDENNIIELKSIKDSFASAANYLNLIGWNKDEPCFMKIELKDNTPIKFLNTSAQKINYKKKLKYYKKYINNFDSIKEYADMKSAIITPDKDIVESANIYSPAYIVFSNYELILKWNRSLRFALAVCTLKDNIKNEL